MKQPRYISQERRFVLYRELASFPLSFSEKDIALYTQHCRVDPRLAEVVTEHIRDFWWRYSPGVLNKALKKQPWPASIRPMLNQISEYCEGGEDLKAEFREWARKVCLGIGNVPPQLYFATVLFPRSETDDLEVTETLPSFSRVGYFARDLLFNKGLPKMLGRPDQEAGAILDAEALMKIKVMGEIRPMLLKMSLKEIEEKFQIDRTTASKLRGGKVEKIGLKRLFKIQERVGLSPDWGDFGV